MSDGGGFGVGAFCHFVSQPCATETYVLASFYTHGRFKTNVLMRRKCLGQFSLLSFLSRNIDRTGLIRKDEMKSKGAVLGLNLPVFSLSRL